MMDILEIGVIVSHDKNPTWVTLGNECVGGLCRGTQGSGVGYLLHAAGLQVIHGRDVR